VVGQELGPAEQGLLPLPLALMVRARDQFDHWRNFPVARQRRDQRLRFRGRPLPAVIDEQRVGLGGDLLGFEEDFLDRLRVGFARDQLARQRSSSRSGHRIPEGSQGLRSS